MSDDDPDPAAVLYDNGEMAISWPMKEQFEDRLDGRVYGFTGGFENTPPHPEHVVERFDRRSDWKKYVRDLMDEFDIARWLHRNYEEIAADVGWETQDGTTVPFEDLPDDNKEVMNRLAERLQEELRERLDAEDDC